MRKILAQIAVMQHILTWSDGVDVKFPLRCHSQCGAGYRQPWGSGKDVCICTCSAPHAALWQQHPGQPLAAVEEHARSCGCPVSLDSTCPGLLSDCVQLFHPMGKGIGSSWHECLLFTWGAVKWMVKLLSRVRASITPTVRQRSSGVPSWAGETCAAEPS